MGKCPHIDPSNWFATGFDYWFFPLCSTDKSCIYYGWIYCVHMLFNFYYFITFVPCKDIGVNIITKYSDYVTVKGLLMFNGGSLLFSILLYF